ncbi:MAG TPA: MFS transporter [Thermoplasmata archaeon]|nr:MFS transporter [Thermoplasmata archaeon]
MEAPPSDSKSPSGLGFSAIPSQVRWIVGANAFGAVGFGYLMVFITAYLPEVGVESGVVGLVLGAEGAAMVLSAIPLGLYSDRRGRKGLLLVGSIMLPPSILVFALTREPLWLVLASIVAGVGEGAFLSTWNAIIADQTTTEQRNAAFSLSFILNNVASGIGFALPLAFPLLQGWTGLDSRSMHIDALVVTDLLGFLAPVAFFILLRDYHEKVVVREARPRHMDWKPLLKFSGLNGLIGLGAGFFVPLVATWLLLKYGVLDTWSGPVLALANLTIGLAAIVSTPLARKYGPVRAIVLVQGLSTVFMLSLAFLTNAVVAAGFYIVRAALMNMSSPISDSFLMGIIAPEQRGLASAVNSIIWRLPNSITTVIGGLLMEAGLLDLPIFIAAAFYIVSISGFYLVFRSVRPTS